MFLRASCYINNVESKIDKNAKNKEILFGIKVKKILGEITN